MRRGFLTMAKPVPGRLTALPDPVPDRLTALPDPILHHIVSLLPTDEMVRTSILSRRWRRIWTFSPVLHFTPRNFSTDSIDLDDYPSIVDRCLSLCSSSDKIRSVRFPLAKTPRFSLAADRWIRFSADRSVEELTFTPVFLGKYRIELPPSLFDCRSLTVLELNGCLISSVPSGSDGFPSLRTIVFNHLSIGDDSLEALLSACPRIENLSVSCVREITRLVIRAPMMRHLMVYDCSGLNRVEIVEAPELRRLMYCGDLLKLGSLEGVVPKLEEVALLSSAKGPFKNPRRWKRFISSIAHARVLSVNCWFFKFTLGDDFGSGDQPVVFKNLKEFHWWPVYKKSTGLPAEPWNAERISADSLCALFSLLRDCPSLEQLCILSTYYLELENAEFGYLSDSSADEYCSEEVALQEFEGLGYELPCLKTVRITEFSGRKEEMKLVEYLADKAVALESVSLHYVGEVKEKMRRIRREVSDLHKASPHVSISFSEFDEDKVCPKHENIWFEYMVF